MNMIKERLERNKRRAYNTYIQARATYSSVMTSPPDSSVTARQNSREESRSSQMLLPTIFVLSKSIETSIVSKGLPEVVVNDVVARPVVTAVSDYNQHLRTSSILGFALCQLYTTE